MRMLWSLSDSKAFSELDMIFLRDTDCTKKEGFTISSVGFPVLAYSALQNTGIQEIISAMDLRIFKC